jgi:hypothetical protein
VIVVALVSALVTHQSPETLPASLFVSVDIVIHVLAVSTPVMVAVADAVLLLIVAEPD